MKTGFADGSDAATAALAKLDARTAFLAERRQTVALTQAGRQKGSAYVWRRVFLKRRKRKA